jgi:hypothetical protein
METHPLARIELGVVLADIKLWHLELRRKESGGRRSAQGGEGEK